MTDQELKDLVASLAIDTKAIKAETKAMIAQAKANNEKMTRNNEKMTRNNEKMALNDEKMTRNDEKLTRMGLRLGNIQENNGEIAEEYFYNSINHTMKLGDIPFDFVYRNLSKHIKKSNIQGEYDMILVNGSSVAIIETKYKMHQNDVLKVKEKLIPKFKKLFPEYKDYKLFAGIASFHINTEAKELAKELGFYILEKVGNVLQTNDQNIHAY